MPKFDFIRKIHNIYLVWPKEFFFPSWIWMLLLINSWEICKNSTCYMFRENTYEVPLQEIPENSSAGRAKNMIFFLLRDLVNSFFHPFDWWPEQHFETFFGNGSDEFYCLLCSLAQEFQSWLSSAETQQHVDRMRHEARGFLVLCVLCWGK